MSLPAALLLAQVIISEPPGYQPPVPLEAFASVLHAQPSATAALAQWCETRGMTWPEPAEIAAEVLPGRPPRPPVDARKRLGIGAGEPLGFRHVRLGCGPFVLSEAYNWYVPARLTAEMNVALASSQVPFGKVAAPLRFTRVPLSSQPGRAAGCPRDTVLADRAVLRLPDGNGLALVVECYTGATIGPVVHVTPAPQPPEEFALPEP